MTCSGGAWVIGYKAWGALLGRRLANRGVLLSSLPGLQVTIPSHLQVYCHEAAASECGIQTSKCWETALLDTPFEAEL
jgi:hypothetical protein